MFDKDDVTQRAIAEGIISDEQRAKLEALAISDAGDSQERFQSVGTLNEIFVTVGVHISDHGAGRFYCDFSDKHCIKIRIDGCSLHNHCRVFSQAQTISAANIYAAISCA